MVVTPFTGIKTGILNYGSCMFAVKFHHYDMKY